MAEKRDMHDVEACGKIFVSWLWMIGIIVSLMGAGVAAAWAGSKVIAETNAVLETHNVRINHVELQTSKIDTVIQILRAREK